MPPKSLFPNVLAAVGCELHPIGLEGGFALEVIPCDSDQGEYSEHWRLLGHRPDGSHFVVTAYGVEREDGPGDNALPDT